MNAQDKLKNSSQSTAKGVANLASSDVSQWLAERHGPAFPFQSEAWAAIAAGRSGLLHATTGSGKTFAVWLGVLQALIDAEPPKKTALPLSVIWLTPMRALASDTARAQREPLADQIGRAHV